MTDRSTAPRQIGFSFFSPQVVTAAFDDGAVTSNSGIALVAQLDRRMSWTERIARCLRDPRNRAFIVHDVEALVRQRTFQIVAGYEDATDSNVLRSDPLLKAACGRHPAADPDLASQPTFSRLENDRELGEVRQVNALFVERYVERRRGRPAPSRIVIDVDPTDDPTHGQQELAFFHGFYDQWMYHPLLVFDGESGELLSAVLREGNAVASDGAVDELRRIVRRVRAEWPRVRIVIRADSAFGKPELYEFCEREGLEYVFGLQPNSRLKELAAPLASNAADQYESTGEKARLFAEVTYAAKTWTRERRVIIKAEHNAIGPNVRFVVTSLRGSAAKLYEFYCGRCDSENRIKDLKRGVFADRLSCHRFVANAFRLVLHAAAYVLMWELRATLTGTDLARAQFDTLRLRLIKIGARVVVSARRIWLHMTSACPDKDVWLVAASRLVT